MATLGAFLTVEPIEPIPPSLADALDRWIECIQMSDTEDRQVTELFFAIRTILHRPPKTYRPARVGLQMETNWDLRKTRVVGRPQYTETDLFKSLIENRREKDDKALVSGQLSVKRKEAAIQGSGLRLPDICLVGSTHQDTLPSQSSAAETLPVDEPAPKRKKLNASSMAVQSCGPHDTAMPAWILEYKPRLEAKFARACLGKTSLYLAACFEMAGTFLATAMAGQYFVRLLALGDKHLAVEIDFTKWPECPRNPTLSELLERIDITKAFVAGHCFDVTLAFDTPFYSPNSAVKPFFEPILLAYDLLKDKPSDQLMTALQPPEEPDGLWTQLKLCKRDINMAAYHADPGVYQRPPKRAPRHRESDLVGNDDDIEDDGDSVGEEEDVADGVDRHGRDAGGRLGGASDRSGRAGQTGSSSQQPGSGPRDSSGQPGSMALADAPATLTNSTMKAALDLAGFGELGAPANVNPLNASDLPEPSVTPSPTSHYKPSTLSKKLPSTWSSSTQAPSVGSYTTTESLSSAPSSVILVTPPKYNSAKTDTWVMPADSSTSFADFFEDPGLSDSSGLFKGHDIADTDGPCLGASAATLYGDDEDDEEEDDDDFYWDPAPGDDIKFTTVSHDTFQALLQCARDRFNSSSARPKFATAL